MKLLCLGTGAAAYRSSDTDRTTGTARHDSDAGQFGNYDLTDCFLCINRITAPYTGIT